MKKECLLWIEKMRQFGEGMLSDNHHPNAQALQIVGKAVYMDPRGGVGVVILLTVHNPNDFPR
jgi:hypothetical protein